MIATEGLTKVYGSTSALTDLTMEVRKGEVYGLLGPNGSGKTTTIRLLLGLLGDERAHLQVLELIEQGLHLRAIRWVRRVRLRGIDDHPIGAILLQRGRHGAGDFDRGHGCGIDRGQRDGVDQHARIFGRRLGKHPLARAFLDHPSLSVFILRLVERGARHD